MSYREDNALAGAVLAGLALAGYGAYHAAIWLWHHTFCLFVGF